MSDEKQWAEIIYYDGERLQVVYGTVSPNIEEGIIAKPEDAWIRLEQVRYIVDDGADVEKLEDDALGLDHYLYLRSRHIVQIAAIRPDVQYLDEGRAPRGKPNIRKVVHRLDFSGRSEPEGKP